MMQFHRSSDGPPSRPGHSRPDAGFTLLELMTVVALIGLLAVVGIPNLIRAKVRAEMLAQVKTVQQAFAVARINAIKGGQPVAVSIQNVGGVPTMVAWVDADGQEDFDQGTERVVGRWTIRTAFTVSEDPTLRFYNLGGVGGPNGALFLPTGAAVVAEGGAIGVGQAGMIISDIKGNQLRLRIQAGTGSVVQEMRIPDTSDWDARASRYWRY